MPIRAGRDGGVISLWAREVIKRIAAIRTPAGASKLGRDCIQIGILERPLPAAKATIPVIGIARADNPPTAPRAPMLVSSFARVAEMLHAARSTTPRVLP